MAWRASPEAPGGAMQRDHIGKPILRLVLCIAVVFAVSAALYAVPFNRRPLSAALRFLFVVLIASAAWGFRYALFVSFLAALGFSWLLPPVGRFWLSDPRDVYVLVAFLVIGITTSHLSDRARREALNANQRRAEAVAAHQRFRDLVNSVEGIVWEADAYSFVFSFVSEQAERILGYPVEQWLREPTFWKDHIHSEDRDLALQFRVQATTEIRNRDFEYRMIAADGRVVWLRDLVTVVLENGRATQLRGVTIDITNRKRTEESLRRSEAYLAEAQRLTKTGSWAFKPGLTKPLYWSDEMFRIWGFDQQQGLPDNETAWQRIHPEDLKAIIQQQIEEASTGNLKTAVAQDLRIVLPDGTVKHIHGTSHPVIDDSGKVVEYIGTSVDVTEHKRAEDSLRRSEAYLAEAQRLTKTGSWAYNPFTGKTIYWSDEMFRMFGLDPQEGPSSDKFWQLVHPKDLDRVRARVEREAHEKKEYADEYRIVLRDGTLKHILDIGHPVFNGAGEVVEFVGTTVDVTERKRAEEELQRSESYLAEAQKLTKTGSLAWDPVSGKTLHCSDEVFRMFGLDPQRGMPAIAELLERVHPEDREYVTGRSRKGPDDKAEHVVDYRLLLPDGILKYIHSIRHPILNDAREVVEFLGTIIDVTEQKRAEETLRRSEAYLADAQKLSHTGSWAWSPVTGEVPYWSEEMFRIFGLDPQQGPPTSEAFWKRVHPEDRDSMQELMRKAAREKREYEHDHRIVFPDGTVKHIHAIGHPVLDRAGDVVEFVDTAVDVTERKRAEEEMRAAETRFRTFVDHATDALFVHSSDQGRVVDVNQRACESLGYTREELIGMKPSDFDCRVDPAFEQRVRERLEAGEVCTFEASHRRKDGTVFPVEVRMRLFWHVGVPFGLSLVRDITDRKRAEQERERLRQLEADLAHINRVSMMGELAASLAHEIKQPIAAAATNVGTCLRWLQRQPAEIEEAREAAARIAQDVNRAADVINRVRSLYTKGDQQRELLHVNEVIEEMIVLLRDEASRYSILIRRDLATDLPKVIADRVQLQQVFMNLMLNGIEAMKETGGELTIKSQSVNEGQLLISVSDIGVGLPADEPDRIFNAFFTTKPQGTGMGLAITRSIIEAHGGRLWASANTGRGATFHFTLPTTASSTSAG